MFSGNWLYIFCTEVVAWVALLPKYVTGKLEFPEIILSTRNPEKRSNFQKWFKAPAANALSTLKKAKTSIRSTITKSTPYDAYLQRGALSNLYEINKKLVC